MPVQCGVRSHPIWDKARLLFYWHFRKIIWALNGTLWKKKAFEKAFIAGYLAKDRLNRRLNPTVPKEIPIK